MARFEASFYPGEDNERLPEWCVVEWTYINPENGSKSGNTVWKTYDMMNGEAEAKEMAAILQHAYNLEFAVEFA
jgi:hypothetical protein